MARRQIFSEYEKSCLKELIVKYKLNSTATIAAGNPNVKKVAWGRLTEAFNSIETNIKRTESQLKKCWDNMKTRRKQALACEKRERMKTGGGPCPGPSTSQDSHGPIDDALQDVTDVEMRFVRDRDSLPLDEVGIVDEASFTQNDRASTKEPLKSTLIESAQSSAVVPSHGSSEFRPSDYGTQSQSPEDPPRRTGSRLSDYGAQSQTSAARNVRAHVITEEFSLRRDTYNAIKNREEELHKLKIAERKWLLKAAEEKYHKARLEKESAEELLKCSKAQRAEAELRLEILKRTQQ